MAEDVSFFVFVYCLIYQGKYFMSKYSQKFPEAVLEALYVTISQRLIDV
jgi:hypothetical protein